MGHEVDFLPVGNGQRSGDRIALHYGDILGNDPLRKWVVVIDGGFQETGDELVEHIRAYYNTNYVDLVVSTHSDFDHAGGLLVVLEKMKVGRLWMHRPWAHPAAMEGLLRKSSGTALGEKLWKSLNTARDLEKMALSKGITIEEPFAGLTDPTGQILVLGPSKEYYEELLPSFRGMPGAEAETSPLMKAFQGLAEVAKKIAESWDIETLDDKGETSAENNSSAILLVRVDGQHLLFTGDAGIPALWQAADRLNALGLASSHINFAQLPHHGSHHNVGPTVLNRLIGERLPKPGLFTKTAFASTAKDDDKHPSRKVTNAFQRRGAKVFATNGVKIWHRFQAPDRGWADATPLPFYTEVEE